MDPSRHGYPRFRQLPPAKPDVIQFLLISVLRAAARVVGVKVVGLSSKQSVSASFGAPASYGPRQTSAIAAVLLNPSVIVANLVNGAAFCAGAFVNPTSK